MTTHWATHKLPYIDLFLYLYIYLTLSTHKNVLNLLLTIHKDSFNYVITSSKWWKNLFTCNTSIRKPDLLGKQNDKAGDKESSESRGLQKDRIGQVASERSASVGGSCTSVGASALQGWSSGAQGAQHTLAGGSGWHGSRRACQHARRRSRRGQRRRTTNITAACTSQRRGGALATNHTAICGRLQNVACLTASTTTGLSYQMGF